MAHGTDPEHGRSLREDIDRARELYATDPDEAERLARDAGARAEAVDDREAVGDALSVVGMALFCRGDLVGARQAAEAAMARWEGLGPSRGQADTWLLLGAIQRRRGEAREAVVTASRGLEVARRIGDVDLQTIAHNNVGLIYGDLGVHDEALSHYLAALELLDGASSPAVDRRLRASLYNNVALVHSDRHEHEDAVRRLEQAIDLARRDGDLRQEARIGRNLATNLGKLGRWDEATHLLERVAALYERLGEGAIGRALQARSRGEIALSRGDLDEAERELSRAVRHARVSGEVRESAQAALRLGRVLHRLGRLGEAERVLRAAIEEAERLDAVRLELDAVDQLTDVLEDLGRVEEALGMARRGRALARRREEEARGREVAEVQARFDVAQRHREAEMLRERSEELERLVGERTAELQALVAELRVARDRAEAADRTKSTFLAIASHELRTPLNAIIGYAEMVREDLGVAEPEELASDLDRILASADRLLKLIDGILQMSNLESGAGLVSARPFALEPVIRDIVDELAPGAAAHGNRLELELSPLPGPMVSDRDMVRAVVHQLVDNAAKFTRDGIIGLSAAVYAGHGAPTLVLRITDTGIGMDVARLEEVFEPFSQLDAGSTRRHGGLGLGLALCRRYCELLRGELTVSSAPGHGSVFEVRLPWCLELRQSAGLQPPESAWST